ncbi:MAG: MarC family protein [Candidatus Omnitrophica bacterium]|nr:MarC family protein [Candidatus Omnitrophota bacterium]
MIKDILLAFIPIFVAVDAIGVLPIYVSFTEGIKKKEKTRIIIQSMITAICLAAGFIFLGKAVFKLLNITVGDFMVAGGLVLLGIAILDILNPEKRRRVPVNSLGAVPLGTPLIVGPAVLTTSLIIITEHGAIATLTSVVINVLLAGLIFSSSQVLIKVLGEAGSKALSKIMSLLLAAIAVTMIRKGIMQFFGPT